MINKIKYQKEAKLRFQEWIDQAKDDFKVVKITFEHGFFEWSTFSCQQVLEKFFKGIYLLQKIEYPPHTHDLIKLANLIEPKLELENSEKYLKDLTKCYIGSRYPEERIGQKKFEKLFTKESASKLFEFTNKVILWYTKKLNFKF